MADELKAEHLNWLADAADPKVRRTDEAYVWAQPLWEENGRQAPRDEWCQAALRYAARLIGCPEVRELIDQRLATGRKREPVGPPWTVAD